MDTFVNKLISYNQSCRGLLNGRLSSISPYLFKNKATPAAAAASVQEAIVPQEKSVKPISKPNFELSKIVIEPGQLNASNDVKSFLHSHYFKHQPLITFLRKPPSSSYLNSLVEKYSTTGDRWLAYRLDPNMRTRRLVGVVVASKKHPWEVTCLEQAAQGTLGCERYHMYFQAYCTRAADVFTKYRIPYVYDIELLAAASSAAGRRMEDALLRTALRHVLAAGYCPLVQVLATTQSVREACIRAGMMLEWSTSLSDIADETGEGIFSSGNEVVDETTNAELYVRLFRPINQTSNPFPSALFGRYEATQRTQNNNFH